MRPDKRLRQALALAALTASAPAVAQEIVVPTEWVGDLRDLPGAPAWRAGDAAVEIPRRSLAAAGAPAPLAGTEGVDRLLARQAAVQGPLGADGFGTLLLDFAGLGYAGATPPDTVGDVGPSHYIQAVNSSSGSRFVIYDKSGSALTAPILMETLGSGVCATGWADPVVIWDPLADRWVMLEFATPGAAKTLCVYVSKSADPVAGGWWAYAFQATDFPDYPKLAVWPEAYFVTTNESVPAIYALERAKMLDGLPATQLRFPDAGVGLPGVSKLSGFIFNALTPADLDGAEPPPAGVPAIFARHRDTEAHGPGGLPVTDQIELFELTVDFATPTASVLAGPLAISITEFSSELCGLTSFSCVPQPGWPVELDPLREVVMHRLAYRRLGAFEQLVGNFVTDAGDFTDHHAVRWFELERRDGGSWQVRQEGTYAPDSIHRWMGAIASDREGNLALGFNVSRATAGQEVYPGLRYAGRRAEQPIGTLPEGEHVARAGTSHSAGSGRYGDYAAMAVDPADDCTFWLTGEYNPVSTWATRVLAFRFDGCDAGLIYRDGFELGSGSRWTVVVEPPPPPP